ncbi:MAG: ABC transporter permease [Clostridia bacterium]|nr:ABC transporter permease [Clostridia bacterium]
MTTFITFLVSTVRLGMTLLFGATGEAITEKSGHLNLGIPGTMCVGAACGCVAESIYFTSVNGRMIPVLAVLIPIIATFIGGALMGLIYSFFTVTLRANQNVTGLVLTTFGIGISNYMIAQVKAEAYTFAAARKYFTAGLPFSKNLGWFGELFLSYGVMIYLAIAVAILTSIVLNKTRLGLHLRAVGENPATADAAGINVTAYRYGATCIGCGIAALGGITFVMDYLGGNWEYVIDSIGWLSVALVIFMAWRPSFGILCAIVFGAFYVASSYIPGINLQTKELFKMLPYLVTIVVLVVTSIRDRKEDQPPAGLGLNYYREER